MLEIKNLYVKYNNSQTASIEEISFKVERGDRIAILGPSGCGKTTLLHVLAGLLKEKDAQIEGILDWRSAGNKKPTIRMVFQEARLLPWRTVEKNISFGLEILELPKEKIQKEVFEILKIVGLADFAKKYPHELSIGMQQRVNFARALVCEPELLLLDEPFSALDLETKNKLQSDFLRIIEKKNITSIFVTHNMQEAVAMANKIIILTKRPGKVIEIYDGKIPFKIESKLSYEYSELE